MDQPIILCGLGRVGVRVLEYLRTAGLKVVVVDTECTADDPRLGSARLVRGDCRRREVLAEAGVDRARGVLVLTSDDLVNVSCALAIRQLHPEVRVVLRLFNQNLIARLGKAVHNIFALSTSTLTAPLIALTALTGQALGAFRIEGLVDGRRQVALVRVEEDSDLLGCSVADAAGRALAEPVALFPAAGAPSWLPDVNVETRLAAGDRLVLCGEPRGLAPLLADGSPWGEGSVHWAGWLRRQGRMVRRTLAEMDRAVKICAGVLVSVIFVSTLVFHFGVERDRLADAFFRTISVMATGADMHKDDLKGSAGLEVFAAGLRICGAALTAAFTAIVTNYLIRARLGGALEVRRIPDAGHVVVCGLGSVGFRVIEELVAAGERVVAIEVSRDNRFVATARRLGAAVIIGDATVAEVLRQAHASTARAVIAGTSEELLNLEIALLVRELNPRQRVVLRLADPDLAKMLREEANVRLALSVSSLAAPAFVAALFGDRVLSVFLLEGRLVAVVDLVIAEHDVTLCGQAARAVAVDYRLLPVALLANDGKASARPLTAQLGPGDRLVALITLPDLQKLLRREAVPKDRSVEVKAFPLPARDWLAGLVKTQKGLSAEEAEKALDHLPLTLGAGLTRGQAEDLLARLVRERITAVSQGGRP